jgi:gliding motility-associated-like protein
MIIQTKQIILFLLILCFSGQVVSSQDHKTKNNYTGAWETPTSWDPEWPSPQHDVNNLDITINGYITANNSLSFSGGSSKLIVDDTLVVRGNLTINDNNDLQVNDDGILIVRGNLTFINQSDVTADGYVIVTGDIIKKGSINQGEFDGDDEPVKVFIGGTISPSELTDDQSDFELLNCTSPSDPYLHSGCSYGNMEDIVNDPVYPFFQSTCSTATLTSSDTDNSFCAGTSVTFTAGGGTNFEFRVNGTSVQNSGSNTYTTTTLTNGSIVDVIVTSPDGCTVTSSGITNTVFARPEATATSNSPVCSGSPLTLTGVPAGMATYAWTGPDGFTANTQSPTVSPGATVEMSGDYSLSVTDANGCTGDVVTTTVVVNSQPEATATSNSPVCTGNPLKLTGIPAGMSTYAWTGPDGFTANTQSPTASPDATGEMAGDYSLTVTDANGCTGDAVTTTVIVNENPIAIAGPDQELEYVFETQMKAELASSETGEWSLITGSGHISDNNSPTSLVTELSPGENIFLWKVYNSNCEARSEVKITVHDLFVPSVITPNGDGKNDYFKISENIGKISLIIINRWGNVEYNNDDYRNEWDGRNNNGAELPYDTYFYILKFEYAEDKALHNYHILYNLMLCQISLLD